MFQLPVYSQVIPCSACIETFLEFNNVRQEEPCDQPYYSKWCNITLLAWPCHPTSDLARIHNVTINISVLFYIVSPDAHHAVTQSIITFMVQTLYNSKFATGAEAGNEVNKRQY